jgi:isoleucyl-tRNA synthetase
MKVLEKLSSEVRNSITPLELRKEAKAYALSQIEIQKKEFKRWGVLGEWDNPYLTMDATYEAEQIAVFADMVKKGLIYRDFKPVYWSPSSKTALAEAELEYRNDHVSPSVYVLFEIKEVPSLNEKLLSLFTSNLSTPKKLYAAIWTTTPWTLPANLAICVGDNIQYSVVADQSTDQHLIVASELVDTLASVTGKTFTNVLESIPGSALVGSRCAHPLDSSRKSVILSGNHVTTESGTGLVHTAPGHGQDDFVVCKAHGIPPLCPVDDTGHFTSEAGERFVGKFVLKEGNAAVIEALKQVPGALLFQNNYTHKYPYDWRTKKPVIVRATRQWFADLRLISQSSVAALANVNVVPPSGLKRLESMLGTRQDWCISRQRSWGVPIPVLYDIETDEPLLTEESIAHIRGLMHTHGSDCWWSLPVEELLAPEFRDNGRKYRRGNDTMDVWFDSGSSWAGVLSTRNLPFPADMYLEGSDQHRGWFQSSLLTSVAVHNGMAPYKTLLTHGFLLDEKLQKMSKSLGNVIEPSYVIEGGKDKNKAPAYGVDVMRLWVASTDYTDDVVISDSLLASVFNSMSKLRNTSRFMLGVLNDYVPKQNEVPYELLHPLDKYMLHKLTEFIANTTSAYEAYSFFSVIRDVNHFTNTDLSAFYLNILKDRLYSPAPNDHGRRSAQTTISYILDAFAKVLAPISVHTSEDIYQFIPWKKLDATPNPINSIYFEGWPVIQSSWRNELLNEQFDQILEVRSHAYRLIEHMRSNGDINTSSEVDINIYTSATHPIRSIVSVQDLEEMFISAEIRIHDISLAEKEGATLEQVDGKDPSYGIKVEKAKLHKCSRCWRHVAEQKESLCIRCEQVLPQVTSPL